MLWCDGILLVIILLLVYQRTCVGDGFRTESEKSVIVEGLQKMGEPLRESVRKLGLDGVEYYTVKQLWRSGKYSDKNIKAII